MTSNDVEAPAPRNTDALGDAPSDLSQTVEPKVLWQREHRRYTDKWWGIIFVLSYIAYIGCGTAIALDSKPRYEIDSETDLRYVSSHFEDDVRRCCAGRDANTERFDLCSELRDDTTGRYLAETGNSTFHGDEGIFDVFLEAPEIFIGILGFTLFLAIFWVVLLRFCAKPIVIGTEVVKIGLFVYAGIVQQNTATRVLCFFCALGILLYDLWARKQILFAADIISFSVVSFKENPVMFVALIIIQLIFAGNAFLFVFFFSESFEAAEVQETEHCLDDFAADGSGQTCTTQCEFVYPSYIRGASIYMSFAYLWTIFLFHKMRLSVIATIIGSWHFQPEEKAGIGTALLNTVTTSFGTLSVSSLISTAAEKINRMAQEPCYKSWLGPGACVTAPLALIVCIFGSCISTLIKMLTKFAVILHVWTGLPFIGSAKKVAQIMSRHFKGGFVTEVTSQGILKLGSYVFSVSIALVTWVWIDDRFNTNSFPGGSDATYFILYILLMLFNLWYPVLGIYLNILLDSWLRNVENQHLWLPPLTAIFVGCLAMIFFTFISEIFLDTIDTLFLCFAVDKDNNVSKNSELEKLVSALPGFIGESVKEDVEEAMPTAVGVPIVVTTGFEEEDASRM